MKARAPLIQSLTQPASWLLAASGLILYVWAPTTMLEARGGGSAIQWWVPVAAPPVLYSLLLLGLPGLSTARRAAAAIVLCGVHVLLALVTPVVYSALGLVLPGTALDSAVWEFPAAPILQLFSVPLVVFPFRDLLFRSRHRRRRRGVGRAPTPPPIRAARVWEAEVTLHTAGGERLREGDVTPEWRRPPRPLVSGLPAAPATPARPAPSRPDVRPAEAPADLTRSAAPRQPATDPVFRPAPVAVVDAPAPVEPIAAPPPTVVPQPATRPASPEVDQAPRGVSESLFLESVELEPVEAIPAPASARAIDAVAAAPAAPATLPDVAEAEPEVAPDHSARVAWVAAGLGRLGPLGPLEVDAHTLMGATLFTALSPRLARDAVVSAAFRVLSFLAERPGAPAVTQATVRGSDGVMVLTPLGPVTTGGPVLVAATPHRGSLALLELRSLRLAADAPATPDPPSATAGPPEEGLVVPSRLSYLAVPGRVDQLARSLAAWGPLTPAARRDPSGRLLLYLFLPPGVDAETAGGLAADFCQALGGEGGPGGIGTFQSLTLRLGRQRVTVRPVAAAASPATVLVVAGDVGDRPGLAGLQMERAAARLAAP
ncbi:MAG TPA: hypothetical protein VGW35_08220 [Methylomirabilota bacterium]|nr:hypothetical protein [Methylomirabilota bacterium]